MRRKHQQPWSRLLSVVTVSAGLLLARANLVMPAVSTVRAAEPGHTTTQASHADTSAIPKSNPYADSTQCVYRAWELAARAGHKLPWFAGDAKDWREGAMEHGLKVSDTIDPSVVHSVAVWDAGVGGAGYAGHVAWVVEVKGNRFRVQERNWVAGTDTERWVTWEKGISFIKLEEPKPAPAPNPAPAQAAPAAPAPAAQGAAPTQPLLQGFVVQPWQPQLPSADALRTPLPGLTHAAPWPAQPGVALDQPLAAPSLLTGGPAH